MTVDIQGLYGHTLTPQITSGDPTTVNDAEQRGPLGHKIIWKGNVYRYVLYAEGTDAATLTPVAQDVVYWKDLDPAEGDFQVSNSPSDSQFGCNGVAGILGTPPTDGYYTYIQIGGVANIYAGATNAAGARYFGSAILTHAMIAVALGATGALQTLPYGALCFATQLGATSGDGDGLAQALLSNLVW